MNLLSLAACASPNFAGFLQRFLPFARTPRWQTITTKTTDRVNLEITRILNPPLTLPVGPMQRQAVQTTAVIQMVIQMAIQTRFQAAVLTAAVSLTSTVGPALCG